MKRKIISFMSKDILIPKRAGLSDEHFQMLVAIQQNLKSFSKIICSILGPKNCHVLSKMKFAEKNSNII